MRYKGIVCLALGLAFSVSAFAVDERYTHGPGPRRRAPRRSRFGPARRPKGRRKPLAAGSSSWLSDNAMAIRGYRGGTDYVLAPAEYRLDSATDLLLHFDGVRPEDEAANYDCRAGASFSIDRHRALLGGGAALFKGPALGLEPFAPSGRPLPERKPFPGFRHRILALPGRRRERRGHTRVEVSPQAPQGHRARDPLLRDSRRAYLLVLQ